MRMRIEGFDLEVNDEGYPRVYPRVRVLMLDGTEIVDTAALSIEGLERLAKVLEAAARNAQDIIEYHWHCQHELRSNARNGSS